MKTIFMIMASISALAVTAPAMAQPRSGEWHSDLNGSLVNRVAFQSRIDHGIRIGAISSREAVPLRSDLRQLSSLERQYARNGFSARERHTLQQRGERLDRQLLRAERSGGTRAGMDSRFDRDNRGDRFAGDVRVGHRPTARMVGLPAQYRNDYRDSESVYFRYDDDRIYQVDRLTNVVTGIMDLPN